MSELRVFNDVDAEMPQVIIRNKTTFKGSDRLCKVVELSMQSCGQILEDLFETYETVTRSINPEFERKVDVQT